jgi:glycosyltransferase involved in cell wall biosynthesis
MNGMRVAIVHDYLNQMGGAERVVAVLHRMFPEAPIHTTIVDRSKLAPELQDADIRTTWMQRIPGILKRFKLFFWLYPFAVQSMKLRDYDLILSSSSAYAKGAKADRGALHICYCHTPMRFAWDFDTYMEGMRVPGWMKRAARIAVAPLRRWDVASSGGVHHFIANSSIVRERIERHYGRSSAVLFPPVDVSRFSVCGSTIGDYYLIVSRLVSYKKLDLAVEACTRLGKSLIVIGDGPDRARLEAMAGPMVKFKGRLPDWQVVDYMKRCKAFLFPGLEDFGITPLEANACGRPVIAFQGGGALDTVKPGVNGMYFEQQTAESLADALVRFEGMSWEPAAIRAHAESFSEARFVQQLEAFIEGRLPARQAARAGGGQEAERAAVLQ